MVKSGLIMGAVMFVLGLLTTAIVSWLCTPCVAIFVGLGAGYLAGVFDKPVVQNDAFKKGAIAGAIAGGIGIIGSVLGGVINASLLPTIMENLMPQAASNPTTMWAGQLGGSFCAGLINVLIMAGLGVGGAAIWNSMKNRNTIPPQPPYPQQY